MTVTGHLGATPDLKRLFTHGVHIPYWWIGEGILKIEFGDERKGICMEDILHTTAKAKKRFFNQSSLVFRLALPDGAWKEINLKLFKNGGFQMTGISSEGMARAALEHMMALHKGRGIWAETPYIKKFDICMMNSDYSIGKPIRRDRLYKILVEEYGLWSTFEPTIYQGVNTKFFWNAAKPPAAPPGICVCPEPCDGDGDGLSIGHCKKITISPFRTGSVIITGAKSMRQLEDAYSFINGVIRSHADQLLREEPTPEPPGRVKKAVQPPTTVEGILRLKMRASPRNIVRTAVNA
jgi:TATA-box binding protein (TBP) (component of TFIID and TFIIIB)